MKILILSAATGGGHLRAAHALEEYINEKTEHEALMVDALKAAGKLIDKTVCDTYLFMAKHTPAFFGKLYKHTNKETPLSVLLPKVNSKLSLLILPAILDYAPDAIVSTHPFVTEMVSDLKQDGFIDVPLVCVITDYGAHRAYVCDGVDGYMVAHEGMVKELFDLGVSEDKIHPFGIPVHDVFFYPGDREATLKELDLDPNVPTVLFMAGSFGVSNIIKLYRDLESAQVDMQIIVITGRNRRLYETFEKEIGDGTRIPTRLLFFTTEVEKYMTASDLLVTKPGGLTVSEALACGLPMAVFDAIPGQEEDNAAYLSDNGMCERVRKDDDFAATICGLLTDEKRLSAMREQCRAFDKSQAVPNLVALLEELKKQ